MEIIALLRRVGLRSVKPAYFENAWISYCTRSISLCGHISATVAGSGLRDGLPHSHGRSKIPVVLCQLMLSRRSCALCRKQGLSTTLLRCLPVWAYLPKHWSVGLPFSSPDRCCSCTRSANGFCSQCTVRVDARPVSKIRLISMTPLGAASQCGGISPRKLCLDSIAGP